MDLTLMADSLPVRVCEVALSIWVRVNEVHKLSTEKHLENCSFIYLNSSDVFDKIM